MLAEQHHHTHKHTVHEHRAPTDESVKLLKEMEQAALGKILDTIRLEASPVDCVLMHQLDTMNDQHDFIIRYQLGKHTRTVRHTFRPLMTGSLNQQRDACLGQLMAVLAEDIACCLLVEPFMRLASGKFPQFP